MPDVDPPRARRILFYLTLAALLARVIYLSQVAALPFFSEPIGDSALYLARAREILAGDLIGDRPFFYGGIFYPYLLALTALPFGWNIYVVCLVQALAGCALAWVLRSIAAPAGGEAAGLLAGGIALFYGPFAFLEADLLMISWTLLLLMTAASLLLGAVRPGAARPALRMVVAGLCLGGAASERPNLAALIPVVAVWAAFVAPRVRRARVVASFLAGGIAIILCVAALNRAASGLWVPLTTSGGINFYIGNHDGARGTFDEPWSGESSHFTASHTNLEESSLLMARRLSGRDLDPAEASRFWMRRGMAWLRANPRDAVALYARKVALFWSTEEVPNHLNYKFLRSVAPGLWLLPLGFLLVAPLGLYGFASRRVRVRAGRPAWTLMAILVAVPMITVLPFFVAERYRIAAVPPLIVMGSCALPELARRFASRTERTGGLARVAALLVVGLLLTRPLTSFDWSRDYWLLAQAHARRGEPEVAARWYREALTESPGDAVLSNNLGVALGRMGDRAGAEAAYRAAIEADPDLAFPHKNLGLLLLVGGRPEEAFQHLVEAEAAEPDDLEVTRGLAALYMARGEPEEARRRALKVLASAPDDPTARAVLAAAEGGITPPRATP